MHSREVTLHADLHYLGHVRRKTSETCDAAKTSGGQRLGPAGFVGRELQDTAHPSRTPHGREERNVLVFILTLRQHVKTVLQRIFSRRVSQLVDKALGGESSLQGVYRSHPPQRHGSFRQYILQGNIRQSVNKRGFIRQIGIDSIWPRLTFLSADGGRDEPVGESHWPARRIYRCAQLMQAGRTISRRSHIVLTRPDHFHWSADCLRYQSGLYRIVVLQ